MLSLEGKTAIVTGASSGIGRTTALLFARLGANVVATARRGEELERLVKDIEAEDGKAVYRAGDVRDSAHQKALVTLCEERFGGLDIAFNNAGTVGRLAQLDEMLEQDWQEVLDINLNAAFLAAHAQIPALRRRGGGSLIFTSSFVGYETAGMPGMAAYGAAKSGLIGLVKSLASDLGPAGIRVNALLPGGTETEMATFETDEQRTFVENMHALKRIAQPEEIAHAALYLASDAASFVTGTAMLADGGVSISKV